MDKKSIVIHDRSKVIFQDSIDGIKTASMGKRKKLYLNHIQFSSIEDGKKYNKEMKVFSCFTTFILIMLIIIIEVQLEQVL